MKLTRNSIVLLTILLLSAVLRFWQLGAVPPSPDWDEAALGWNAYSVLKTGRDEYGTFLPVTLRSFDDYKPPLYMYLTIPAVALFGLDTWVVRLPSAIFGILAVYGTYLLACELTFLMKKKTEGNHTVAYAAAFLLAISPWHLQFSRIAFEANIGVTINIWALTVLLRGLRFPNLLPVSAFLFALGLYAYHSERIFVPLLVFACGVIFRQELWKQRKFMVISILIGIVTLMPLMYAFTNPAVLTRLRGTSSLSDQTGLLARSVERLEEDARAGNPWGVIFDNRRVVWLKTIVNGYLSHYSLKWMFLTGDNPRHHAPDMGLLYLWELPLLMIGMVVVGKRGGKRAGLLFTWFFIAPVAASPTTELPHAIRTLVFLPVLQIFSAVGIETVVRVMYTWKDKFLRVGVIAVGVSCVTFFFLYYLHTYFNHQNREFSTSWQYGYREAVAYAKAHQDKYSKIVVSTKLEQPHMFFLYFLKYDPELYLREGGTSSGGFAEVRNKFGKYEFRPIHWLQENHDGTTLYVGTPSEIPEGGLLTINALNRNPAIRISK